MPGKSVSKTEPLRIKASPSTSRHTGILLYEVRQDGRVTAVGNKGRKIVEIKTSHGEKENTFRLKTATELVDIRYHVHMNTRDIVVHGEFNGEPFFQYVRKDPPAIVKSAGVPRANPTFSKLSRSILKDIGHPKPMGRTEPDGTLIVMSMGHFVTCSLAAIESGISIAFFHPVGLIFGLLGMAACAIWS